MISRERIQDFSNARTSSLAREWNQVGNQIKTDAIFALRRNAASIDFQINKFLICALKVVGVALVFARENVIPHENTDVKLLTYFWKDMLHSNKFSDP